VSSSILSAPMQLETLANVMRSDQLAWRVIRELKLYQAPVSWATSQPFSAVSSRCAGR